MFSLKIDISRNKYMYHQIKIANALNIDLEEIIEDEKEQTH